MRTSGRVARLSFTMALATAFAAASSLSLGGMVRSAGAAAQTYTLADIGAYGGEPSITSDINGVLYDTSPSDSVVYRSTDQGATWVPHPGPDSSGDDCLATDQSTAVYWCNLAGGSDTTPLDADVWKSTDGANTWVKGTNQLLGNGNTCGASCDAAGVDRQWVAASIRNPATETTAQALVVLAYHDFYGPSSIWVNISTDGGATYAPSKNVILSPNTSVNSVTGAITAEGYTFCSSVPAGVGIVPPGKPNAGRIIVGWIAADLPSDLSGCNLTMAASFHTAWVSYSDDGGATWTPQMAYDAGIGHDMSTPFVGFTLDNVGNPYFSFAAPPPGNNPAVCAGESAVGGATLQNDKTCGYDMWVVWSNDQGVSWNPGGGPSGLIPGSAGTAYQVNPSTETGSHWFPAIAAGNPGQVDVAYLLTPTIQPSDALGKVLPGACSGVPPNYPATCNWDLYAAQSMDLLSAPGSATWANADLTAPTPMHQGDICNLGIFCTPGLSNRNLLDFIQVAIDPTTGCAHIGYADDNTVNLLRAANQTDGCLPSTPVVTEATPTPSPSPIAVDNHIPNTSGAEPLLRLVLALVLMGAGTVLGWRAIGRRRPRPQAASRR